MNKLKKYKTIFFDWDGTIVESRDSNIDNIIPVMEKLLLDGVKLIVISGTTYNNICDGKLHNFFSKEAIKNLYLGLGRGVYNYGFNNDGEVITLLDNTPSKCKLLNLHSLAFEFHNKMLKDYNFQTDIVFSRANYCKIDILVNYSRNSKLFMQSSEIDKVNDVLKLHSYNCGIKGIINEIYNMAKEKDLDIKITTDAKYLEVGFTTKSDNVNYFMDKFNIDINECCFWGDEFSYLDEGIVGSDGLMITDKTNKGEFFDVSQNPRMLPKEVKAIGGGIESFINFLKKQGEFNIEN